MHAIVLVPLISSGLKELNLLNLQTLCLFYSLDGIGSAYFLSKDACIIYIPIFLLELELGSEMKIII